MNNRHIYVLSALLAVLSLALFVYKARVLGFPVSPQEETQIWNVEAALSFDPGPAAVKTTLRIPGLTPGFAILDENFVSRGFGLTTRTAPAGREAQWALRQASGRQTFTTARSSTGTQAHGGRHDAAVPRRRPCSMSLRAAALEGLIAEVRRQSADVASFTTELLRHINQAENDPYVSLFLKRGAHGGRTCATRHHVSCRRADPRARGARRHAARMRQAPWRPIHCSKCTTACSGCTSTRRRCEQGLPKDFLIWWRGDERIADIEGGSGLDVSLAVQQNLLDSMVVAERRAEQAGSHSMDFSLFSLPIATQAVYSVLLMIPVGALVIMLLRNFVGVKTFGTFMPVLVALAFRETRLLWGLMLFAIIVSLGLLIRFYLEKLRLLLVPRLTCVLTVVVLLMAGISVLSQKLDIAARAVDRAVPDGHHLDDDRAHVDRVGGARRL